MVKMVEAKRRIVDDFKAGDFHGVTKPRKIISFGMLGRIATGSRYGRWIVDISIATSQLCFGTSALIFTSKNLREVIHQLGNCTDKYDYSASTLIWIVAPLLIPSMFVRQLSKFAVYILIADFFIVAGLLYLYASDVSILSNSGVGPGIIQFDGLGFWSLLATAIYALEGTSFVLPIEHAMENKQNFHRVTYISGFAIGAIYMSFGVLGYLAYGSNISSIITLNLKHDNPHSTPAIMLQLAYCLALLVSFPVTLFPPVRLAEAALFPLTYGPDGQKLTNSKLTWSKNLVRSLLTLLCAVMAIAGGASFSSFIALVGGLMCVPLTLTFPAYFHLKICGDRCSTRELWEDYICVTVGMIGTVACTAIAIYQIFTATATPDYPCVPQ
jgi:proton-coupled amino acid transporter